MIKVKRLSKPSVLDRNEAKWIDAIKSAKSKEELLKAISKYRHKEIKETLSKMFFGKCAFCESYIENVDYGDIEHFKPKSKFPDLAVVWENLLLSCKKCNGKEYKGDQWLTLENGGPLVNPCDEDPEQFFEFIFDEKTQIALVLPKNRRGETSERVFGLNKHDLLRDRNRKVRQLIFIAKQSKVSSEAREIVREATMDSGEFAAFARMVAKTYC